MDAMINQVGIGSNESVALGSRPCLSPVKWPGPYSVR